MGYMSYIKGDNRSLDHSSYARRGYIGALPGYTGGHMIRGYITVWSCPPEPVRRGVCLLATC